jgi:hypothetical protein
MYISPETFLKQPYNEKADVHSFGVLAYEVWSHELLIVTHLNTTKAAELGIRGPPDFARRVRAV